MNWPAVEPPTCVRVPLWPAALAVVAAVGGSLLFVRSVTRKRRRGRSLDALEAERRVAKLTARARRCRARTRRHGVIDVLGCDVAVQVKTGTNRVRRPSPSEREKLLRVARSNGLTPLIGIVRNGKVAFERVEGGWVDLSDLRRTRATPKWERLPKE